MRDFATGDDIIAKVSKNLDIPYEKVEYIFNFLVFYIKKLTWKRNVVAIKIPYLGRLYARVSGLRKLRHKYINKCKIDSNGRLNEINLSKLNEKIDIIQGQLDLGGSNGKLHKKIPRLKNKRLTLNNNLEQLEEIQNEKAR